MKIYKIVLITMGLLMVTVESIGQELDVNLQIRPRFEYRNGFKELMKDGTYPTSFISNRSRLNFEFKQDKIKAKIDFQNVRVWGDIPTTGVADKNGVMLFESWFSYDFNDKWQAKVGRQVISYDNQRIFGGLDWAQQAQSHDALVVHYAKDKMKVDFGAAISNGAENLVETAYNTTYKNLQYVWFNNKFTNSSLSLLALNTGYQYENTTDVTFENAYMQTLGGFYKFQKTNWFGDLGAYMQTGETALGTSKADLLAYNAAINLGYKFNTNFKAELGFEYLSGKAQDDADSKIKSFTPLFGTNHGFNGFMDYFYVGNHKNSVGLKDFYGKLSYEKNKWQFALAPHIFYSAATIFNPVTATQQDSNLGTEIDLTCVYKLDKNITLTGGFSKMYGTTSLELLKGGNKDNDNTWAYVMVSFHPNLFSYKPAK
ncbi:alginate export family protein [Flavobacterium sp.]|uniref:alginate export family protein n=1 Tax=Flavobacterium sp. TaxID=239 RepID=UPI00263023CF|nr:alginate export family protein [Flavobacterium sp.]MDD3005132.1 alginate export family protein [Flavobacterium sp.]